MDIRFKELELLLRIERSGRLSHGLFQGPERDIAAFLIYHGYVNGLTLTWVHNEETVLESHPKVLARSVQKVAQCIVVLRGTRTRPVLRLKHLLDCGKIGFQQKLAGNGFPPKVYSSIRAGSVPPSATTSVFYVAN